jgi:hypothetical protein
MGLLDDAIREHLELKRLRGADPGTVAREAKDVLGPTEGPGETEHGSQVDCHLDASSHDQHDIHPSAGSAPVEGSAATSQETVEINMEAELAAGLDPVEEPEADRAERAGAVAHPTHAGGLSEESLEWEVPGEDTDQNEPESEESPNPGQGHDESEPVEDVLEETPDFLRDTPEQERLWFEQRPPRDFDFNE